MSDIILGRLSLALLYFYKDELDRGPEGKIVDSPTENIGKRGALCTQ